MATESMIESAARGPYKPGVAPTVGNEEAILHRPRAAQDVEAAERATAARQTARAVLGRHSCPRLPACPLHGRQVCGCNPCYDPRHDGDAALLAEVARALGLDNGRGAGHDGA